MDGEEPFGGEGFGLPAGEPLSTKPRQLPSGGGTGQGPGGMQMLNEPPGGSEIDPAMNGGDIGAGEDSPVTAKLRAMAAEVRRSNPGMSFSAALKVAQEAVDRYLKTAEDLSPLLYGDRGEVRDGPLTDAVKNYEPPKPPWAKKDGEEGSGGPEGGAPGLPGGGGAGGAGEAAGGAGEAAEAAGAAEEIAPLIALL